ncbi:MAG TPA: methyl-accepting chemotaxis protein [Clostridiaceae bacterium]|nr:methyl-accepting chemotaxis protein [Clostridiaceae bacterium]
MKKISTRIIALLGLLVFFICAGLGLVAYAISHNSLVGVLKETMPKVAMEASITIEDGIQNYLNTLNIIASLDYMDILVKPDADDSKVRAVMSDEIRRSGHKQMILVNKNGEALFDDGRIADMSENQVFKRALSGEEFVTEPMLDNEGTGIIMIYAVPVKVNGETAGVLMAVRDGLELSEFAGRIKFGETGEAFIIDSRGRTIAHADTNLLLEVIKTARSRSSSASADTGATDAITSATVNPESPDAVSSATIKGSEDSTGKNAASRPDGSGSVALQLGFEGFIDVQKQMTEGKTGFGEYKFHGVSKVAGFAPFERYGWSIAVSVDKEEMLSGLAELKRTFFTISFIFLLAGFIVAYLMGKGISTPITHLSNECNIMSNGDFSRVMKEKYTRRRDEIGDLARSFNNINVKVSRIIRNVVEEANSVGKAIKNVDENMYALTSEIDFMSGIIGKLSLKMDENSAAAEEMNATSNEIEGAIDSIANETQHSAETAGEVSKRAERLKATAIDSQKRAQEVLMDVAVKLRKAIEQSKAVERIQELTDAILVISSKTNLLALNAEIEASHAGGAGTGFAVVAGEIRNLAENSKQTVNEIKEVTKVIVESVQILSESAGQVLEFLENKVVKDYDMLAVTGEQYNNDAQLLNDMVMNLSATTEQLYASIQNMAKAINDVAVASEAGASETSDLASKAAVIVKRTNEVLQKTNDVSKSADRLLELVSIFKV